MPYVPGSGAHGVTHVADVYRSGNVFVNNVPVALWLPPGASASFAGDVAEPEIVIDPATTAANEATYEEYAANPDKFANPTAETNGVKKNFVGTPKTDETGASVPPNSSAAAADVKSFLDQVLAEAKRGMWRESGQNGKPSNPNIVGIWVSLGYPNQPYWRSDQTPWCMGFLNFVLKKSGYRYVQEAGSIAIKNNPARWNATRVPINQAQPGDMVLWNFGHVNFVYTAQNGRYSFVGGNQTPSSGSNNNPNDGDVSISWPSGWTEARGGIVGIWRPSKT